MPCFRPRAADTHQIRQYLAQLLQLFAVFAVPRCGKSFGFSMLSLVPVVLLHFIGSFILL
jgi:hypothetical protein